MFHDEREADTGVYLFIRPNFREDEVQASLVLVEEHVVHAAVPNVVASSSQNEGELVDLAGVVLDIDVLLVLGDEQVSYL